MNTTNQNSNSNFRQLHTWFAIAGNIIFILWILINGINEGFQGTLLEKISYISLMGLLAVNSFLLINSPYAGV
ncbi:MAG: hypothetical protein JST20_04685, partial [Bacteroidetes bacterium]|nr:hypothetical protein [Bacteroidota bacterium]